MSIADWWQKRSAKQIEVADPHLLTDKEIERIRTNRLKQIRRYVKQSTIEHIVFDFLDTIWESICPYHAHIRTRSPQFLFLQALYLNFEWDEAFYYTDTMKQDTIRVSPVTTVETEIYGVRDRWDGIVISCDIHGTITFEGNAVRQVQYDAWRQNHQVLADALREAYLHPKPIEEAGWPELEGY